jgi:hypothetical protein
LIPVFGVSYVRASRERLGTVGQENQKDLHMDARERAAGASPQSIVTGQ